MYTDLVADKIVRLLLRLPADLHALLVERAGREERSLNQQIVYLLRRALEEGLR